MIPNKEEFIDKLYPNFEQPKDPIELNNDPIKEAKNVVAGIYDTLFDVKLADFSEDRNRLLLYLFTPDIPKNSIEELKTTRQDSIQILKTIKDEFPETSQYLQKVYDYSMIRTDKENKNRTELFGKEEILEDRKKQEGRFTFIKDAQKTLYETFMPDGSIEEYLKGKIWKIFLDDLRASNDTNLPEIEKNVSIESINIAPCLIEIYLKVPDFAMYELFEGKQWKDKDWKDLTIELSYLARKFGQPLKKHWFRLVLKYNIPPKTQAPDSEDNNFKRKKLPVRTLQNKEDTSPYPYNPIEIKLSPDYFKWDDYHGELKDKLLKLFYKSDDADKSSNIYIWWSDECLWKTHLVQAVIKKHKETNPNVRIIYTTGEMFLNEYQRRIQICRDKGDRASLNEFIFSFDRTDILVIDNFEALLGGKKISTQSKLREIVLGNNIQLIMISNTPPAEIKWFKKKWEQAESVPLMNAFNPLLVEPKGLDKETRKAMIENILAEEKRKNAQSFLSNIMSVEIVEQLIEFMAEEVQYETYRKVIWSIMIHFSHLKAWDKINTSELRDIVRKMTGKNILPSKNEIIDITLKEKDNLLDIIINALGENNPELVETLNQYKQEDPNGIAIRSGARISPESLNWLMLRLSIYFIKEIYPSDSFKTIWAQFSRAETSILYADWKSLDQGTLIVSWKLPDIKSLYIDWKLRDRRSTKWKLLAHIKEVISNRWKTKYWEKPEI